MNWKHSENIIKMVFEQKKALEHGIRDFDRTKKKKNGRLLIKLKFSRVKKTNHERNFIIFSSMQLLLIFYFQDFCRHVSILNLLLFNEFVVLLMESEWVSWMILLEVDWCYVFEFVMNRIHWITFSIQMPQRNEEKKEHKLS